MKLLFRKNLFIRLFAKCFRKTMFYYNLTQYFGKISMLFPRWYAWVGFWHYLRTDMEDFIPITQWDKISAK